MCSRSANSQNMQLPGHGLPRATWQDRAGTGSGSFQENVLATLVVDLGQPAASVPARSCWPTGACWRRTRPAMLVSGRSLRRIWRCSSPITRASARAGPGRRPPAAGPLVLHAGRPGGGAATAQALRAARKPRAAIPEGKTPSRMPTPNCRHRPVSSWGCCACGASPGRTGAACWRVFC